MRILAKYGAGLSAVYVAVEESTPDVEYVVTCAIELQVGQEVEVSSCSIHTGVHTHLPPYLSFPYLYSAMSGLWLLHRRQSFRRALVLGLGGGNASRYIRYTWPDVALVSVEASPEMIAVAKLWPDVGPVIKGDAVQVVKRADAGYIDFVLVDCYPFENNTMGQQFFSTEFLRELRSVLTDDGIVAFNFIDDVPPLPVAEVRFNGGVLVRSPARLRESNKVVMLSTLPLDPNEFVTECHSSNPAYALSRQLTDFTFEAYP